MIIKLNTSFFHHQTLSSCGGFGERTISKTPIRDNDTYKLLSYDSFKTKSRVREEETMPGGN